MDGHKRTSFLETMLANEPDFSETIDNVTIMGTALIKKYSGLVEMLIKAGDDVNRLSASGFTPLMFAVKSRSPNMIELLSSNGAKFELLNNDGLAAIHLTILYRGSYGMSWRKSASMVATLVESGDDINRVAKNSGKDTLLTMAAKRIIFSYPAFIKQLLDMGADFNYINGDGNSVLHFAARQW